MHSSFLSNFPWGSSVTNTPATATAASLALSNQQIQASSGLQQGLGYPYGIATTAPIEHEHKIEVPIVEKGDRAGIFLKGEHDELIHITSERLYKMAGVEW